MENEESYFYEADWSQGEEDEPYMSTDESSYVEPWQDDGYISSDFEEKPDGAEPEPEPPDRYHTSQPKPSYPKPIQSWYEEENNYGGESWSNQDYSDSEIEEDSDDEPPPRVVKPQPPKNTPRIQWSPIPRPTFKAVYKTKFRLVYDNGYYYFGPEFFLFNGTDYLQWEKNMNEYFRYYTTPHEEKLSTALGQLTGEALKWWNNEEYERWYYKEPKIRTWEELKWLMCERYSPQSLRTSKQTSSCSKQAIREDKTPTFKPKANSNLIIGNKCKSSEPKCLKELICYRCKQKGHVAKFCPTREATTKTQLVQQSVSYDLQVNAKPATDLPTVSFNESFAQWEKQAEIVMQWFKSLKEKELLDAKEKTNQNLEFDLKEKRENMSPPNGMVQTETCHPVFDNSMTVITHLSFAKGVEIDAGTRKLQFEKEEASTKGKVFSDQILEHEESTPMLNKLADEDDKSVNNIIQIKEEPPDAQPMDQTQCDQVSRTKLLEEGEYDVRINTTIIPELTKTRGGTISDFNREKSSYHRAGSRHDLWSFPAGHLSLGLKLTINGSDENFYWRPGEYYIHLEAYKGAPSCTTPQRIMRISPRHNLPKIWNLLCVNSTTSICFCEKTIQGF